MLMSKKTLKPSTRNAVDGSCTNENMIVYELFELCKCSLIPVKFLSHDLIIGCQFDV